MANKQQSKKEWTKPELIVLMRNKPEEAVLAACKEFAAVPGSGPGAVQSGCWQGLSCS